jgi:hypothetical protein
MKGIFVKDAATMNEKTIGDNEIRQVIRTN